MPATFTSLISEPLTHGDLSEKAAEYARIMRPGLWKAFKAWCRDPRNEKAIKVWADDGMMPLDVLKAGAMMRNVASGGACTYAMAWRACVKAMVVKDLWPDSCRNFIY